MPERNVDTGYWNDPFIQPLSSDGKLLYLYSWTNVHCNQAGIYEITLVTISRETGLDESRLNSAFKELEPKVIYYRNFNLLWCKPFLKRNARSDTFKTAAARNLEKIDHSEIIEEFLNYNHTLSIPYRYPTDTLSIPSARAADQKTASASNSNSNSNSLEEIRGYGGEEIIQDPKLAAIVTLYEQNIGMITPMIAEKLKWIRDTFPDGWFQAALQEALDHNARKLAYIETILERWDTEGFRSVKKDIGKKKTREKKVPEGLEIDE